ncbi:UDP-N-acetylmuramate dehydrogenase [Cryobacterium psychrotolerans]|uniref:UDP-N-acetylenolpyruvoylglucosamine reductase n=1 Tax=Cryobacterium psychrotolerans TaxID=386301 RepID=A0A1G9D962_9MICO|nr:MULTISPECIES: UDP-N-acetylmuramate dehydrogenase [Cryobacterium]TFD47247.1 UDP-N-acetylmuramate dehydrogenase [Cryobacterium sp. TMT1-2-1]TFD90351.1 UDP-N-acetylmuramate dehydrogenase [Cryobacterium psychrotolerans]SDK60383.1 UDP-N-acetylmuramate dehydrogenase [Cryobacterium psychrotolerans]
MTDPVPLSQLTTMRVGGVPARMVAPATEQELVDAALAAWSSDDDWMLLGGGSNTVAGDEGFGGTVIRVITRGIEVSSSAPDRDRVRLRVQAGEPWDSVVAQAVARGWAGIEALSGIPGSSGAAPVQNIGAYGQELGSSLVAIDFLDYETGARRRMEAGELELGYRTSVLKQGLRGVVLAIELDLQDTSAEASVLGSALSAPVAYGQLAGALGVQLGDRVPLSTLRDTVLALRASKGMVLDASDHDTWSAGSFFTNPIVTETFGRTLPGDAPRWPIGPLDEMPDRVIPLSDYAGVGPIPGAGGTVRLVKLSAAWLIEHAGISRGFRLPGSRAAVSSKHTLALTNTGAATADEIAQLARYVQGRVQAEFGVILQPEPVLVGVHL